MNIRIVILLIIVTLFAVPSFAQTDVYPREVSSDDGGGGWSDSGTYALGEYVDNPCTAEHDWTWVTYDVSLYLEGDESDAAAERVLFNESTAVGGGYSASGSSESDVVYMQQPYTLRKYYKVNTWDDFHLVTVINFDPATNSTSVTKETACGNGMPDSAQ